MVANVSGWHVGPMLKVKQSMNILTYEICKKINIYHLMLHKIEYKIVNLWACEFIIFSLHIYMCIRYVFLCLMMVLEKD